jgi:hypothetical protein
MILDSQRKQLIPSVRHEFGHLVIAKAVGFGTGGIKLAATHAEAEVDLLPSFLSLADVQEYSERRIKVLYAGACAEALSGQRVNLNAGRKLFETTAANDHAKIRELTRIVCGAKYPSINNLAEYARQLEKIDDALAIETVEMVEQDASLIEELTAYFMDKLDIEAGRLGHLPPTFALLRNIIDTFPGVTCRFA